MPGKFNPIVSKLIGNSVPRRWNENSLYRPMAGASVALLNALLSFAPHISSTIRWQTSAVYRNSHGTAVACLKPGIRIMKWRI
ncbi:MAG: hypothetical protein PVI54_14450, partial [Desulfobacteraceae bacterium]